MSHEPTELCPRCHDEPKQPGKLFCLDCESSEMSNVELALQAKELAQATADKWRDKYGPAVRNVKDLGVDV